jgi:hypothetical protein
MIGGLHKAQFVRVDGVQRMMEILRSGRDAGTYHVIKTDNYHVIHDTDSLFTLVISLYALIEPRGVS